MKKEEHKNKNKQKHEIIKYNIYEYILAKYIPVPLLRMCEKGHTNYDLIILRYAFSDEPTSALRSPVLNHGLEKEVNIKKVKSR